MIGVTIGVGDKWYKMAQRAADSMHENTGLPTMVINSVPQGIHPSEIRLYFDKMFNQRLLYFDADTYCFQNWDPSRFPNNFLAVKDSSPNGGRIHNQCKEFDIDFDEYFRAGLFICDPVKHKDVFDKARKVRQKEAYDFDLVYEQTALNGGVQKSEKTTLSFIDQRYNALPNEYNDDTVVLTKAGGHYEANLERFQEIIRNNS